jgi:hypothetical protein
LKTGEMGVNLIVAQVAQTPGSRRIVLASVRERSIQIWANPASHQKWMQVRCAVGSAQLAADRLIFPRQPMDPPIIAAEPKP